MSFQHAQIDELLSAYENDVLRTCFVLLGDMGLAEDALQDTFIKVWKKLHTFEGRNQSTLKTWILRIAINTCKDYRRTAWFRHIDRNRAAEELLNDAPPTHETLQARNLALAVICLPDKYKQPILLHYYHGLTLRQTAEVLHISQPAVSKRLQKAYALLQKEAQA